MRTPVTVFIPALLVPLSLQSRNHSSHFLRLRWDPNAIAVEGFLSNDCRGFAVFFSIYSSYENHNPGLCVAD
jgi:hypothetical protein